MRSKKTKNTDFINQNTNYNTDIKKSKHKKKEINK